MRFTKIISAVLAAALGFFICAAPVSAEDFEADTSSAVKSSNWGQSFKLYSTDFDPARITENSRIIVNFNTVGDVNDTSVSPVELVAQCWMVTDENGKPTSDGDIWAKVSPAEFDGGSATFTYADILAAYKETAVNKKAPNAENITDLSGVLCINIGDTGAATVICTGMTITEVGKATNEKGEELTGINQYVPADAEEEYAGTEEFFRVTEKDFDATRLNSGSKMVITYETMSSKPAFSPIDIVLMSHDNNTVPENLRDDEGNVSIKISLPESYNDTQVVFSAQQILAAYGTGNFSQLYDIALTGTSQPVKLKSVEFTNVNQFGTRSEVLAELEAEQEKPPVPMSLIIGIIAGVVVIILIVLFVIAKFNANRTYDISSGSYVKKAPEDEKNK